MKIRLKDIFSENRIILLWCAATAFLLLLICSRSSFLYPCNDWNDANSYFTMGKGMMNGQIIYRDLYDQKGPYLYLVYGIAYLLCHDSFAGVFVFEIIAITAFLYSCHKLMNLYCSKQLSILLLPLLGAGILLQKASIGAVQPKNSACRCLDSLFIIPSDILKSRPTRSLPLK